MIYLTAHQYNPFRFLYISQQDFCLIEEEDGNNSRILFKRGSSSLFPVLPTLKNWKLFILFCRLVLLPVLTRMFPWKERERERGSEIILSELGRVFHFSFWVFLLSLPHATYNSLREYFSSLLLLSFPLFPFSLTFVTSRH